LNSLKENINNNSNVSMEEEATSSKRGKKQQSAQKNKGGGVVEGGGVSFQSLCGDSDRRFVSRCFLELLHLKTQNKIHLSQATAYGSIIISSPVDGSEPITTTADVVMA
jgi:chromatin segregation and condensation protein Rec8/ScpA/Scc1 (kleisin family)